MAETQTAEPGTTQQTAGAQSGGQDAGQQHDAAYFATHDPDAFDAAYGDDDDDGDDGAAAEQQLGGQQEAKEDATGEAQKTEAKPSQGQQDAGTQKPGTQQGQTAEPQAPAIPAPETLTLRALQPPTPEAAAQEAAKVQERIGQLTQGMERIKNMMAQQGLQIVEDDEGLALVATPEYAKAQAIDGKAAYKKLTDEERELAVTDPEKFADVLGGKIAVMQDKRLSATKDAAHLRQPYPSKSEYTASWNAFVATKTADGKPQYPDAAEYSPHIGHVLTNVLPAAVSNELLRNPALAYEVGYYMVAGMIGPQEARRRAEEQKKAEQAKETRPSSAAETGAHMPEIGGGATDGDLAYIKRMRQVYAQR